MAAKNSNNFLKRFLKNRDGVVAIEFAFLAIPFFLLLFAILESCIAFAAQQIIANATDDVSRKIRTGRIITAQLNDGDLRNIVCEEISIIVADGCPGLEIDLRQFSTYEAAAQLRVTINNGQLDTSGFGTQAGGPASINMFRIFYRWPFVTDLIRSSMSNLNDGKTLLFATMTWRNEPY